MPGHSPAPARVPARLRAQDGFTLIEMLVAMVVIAILAAILVPDLFGGKGSSQDTRVKAALDAAKSAAMLYVHEHNDSVTGLDSTVLGELLPTLHETKAPAESADAEGANDPLGVVIGVWENVGGAEPGPVVNLCGAPDKGSAVYCVRIRSKDTIYTEGRTPSQTIKELNENKGTNSYSGSEWSTEGW